MTTQENKSYVNFLEKILCRKRQWKQAFSWMWPWSELEVWPGPSWGSWAADGQAGTPGSASEQPPQPINITCYKKENIATKR